MTQEEKNRKREEAKERRKERMEYYKEHGFCNKTSFIKTYGAEKYRETAIEMFTSYASSEAHFAEEYFCKHFQIMPSCYSAMKDDVIKNAWVDKDVIERAKAKSIANQQLNSPDDGGESTGMSTVHKYSRLQLSSMKKDDTTTKHAEKEMTYEERVKDIAELYADNTGLTVKDLSTTTGYAEQKIKQMIQTAITDNLISDDYVIKIEKRCIQNADPGKLEMLLVYFASQLKIRVLNKAGVALE